MFEFYRNLSKTKKVIILIVGGIGFVFAGGMLGLLLGLISTTFIPLCCQGGSCHNCFSFKGMIGYEATGFIGFWGGLILSLIIYFIFIIYLIRK